MTNNYITTDNIGIKELTVIVIVYIVVYKGFLKTESNEIPEQTLLHLPLSCTNTRALRKTTTATCFHKTDDKWFNPIAKLRIIDYQNTCRTLGIK